MTLISILLAIWLDKMFGADRRFQFNHYFERYKNSMIHAQQSESVKALITVLPLFLYVVVSAIIPKFAGQLLDILVLFLCIGCPHYRDIYKHFLAAAARNDQQACFIIGGQLGVDTDDEETSTVGQAMAWQNYQYYFALFFWFAVAGAGGALLYSTVRFTLREEKKDIWIRTKALLDWLPVRLTALFYLFVGSYNAGFETWMKVVTKIDYDARKMLTQVAIAADEPILNSCSSEDAIRLVNMAKRATLLCLGVIAFATLAGVLK